MANQVDGIISGAHNLGIKEYDNVGLPIVSFDRKLSDDITIVSNDNVSNKGVISGRFPSYILFRKF